MGIKIENIVNKVLRILSPSFRKLLQIEEENKKLKADLKSLSDANESSARDVKKLISAVETKLEQIVEKTQKDNLKVIENRLNDVTEGIIDLLKKNSEISKKSIDEILWGQIFESTIKDSIWLGNLSFSPGRWAVGYQYLYVLYRILNEIKPRSILELGIGQSTKMLATYIKHNHEARHIVVEHDLEWISSFKKDFELPERTEIIKLPLEDTEYKGDPYVTIYAGFEEVFKGKKFDLILIDGPFGFSLNGEQKTYARIDVLKILPNCLTDSFLLLLDDYNRLGEKNTANDIKSVLDENYISFKHAVYRGSKQLFLIASEDYKWMCSL